MPGNGWIKFYRDIQKHWIYKDPEKLKVWITLLVKATHKLTKVNVGYQLVELKPGQLIFGLNKVSKDIDIDRSKLYRIIKMMENDEMIEYDTDSYSQFSVITILKWEQYQNETPSKPIYQGLEVDSETQVKQERNRSETEVKTNNNVKNEKNEKNNVCTVEIEKIYNSLTGYWKQLFERYIDIYRNKNKSGKITDNRHYKLLSEINNIYQEKKFYYDSQEYQVSDEILKYGINQIIDKGIDNLNYAKKCMIGQIENGQDHKSDFVKSTVKKEDVLEWYNEQL